MRARVRMVVRLIAVSAILPVATMVGTPAAFAAISSPNAAGVAAAIKAAGTVVTGASWTSVPSGTPNGISDSPMAGFPTEGSTFAILTNGDVNSADDAPPSVNDNTGTDLGGGHVRGDTDLDVSILKIDFTVGERMNCVRFDFRFLSEEYPEALNSTFNDAFVAEVDQSTWTTAGSAIDAPRNFAYDTSGEPISVKATGNTSMTPGPSNTTYDGATPILTAAHQVSPGAHSLYLSIFDQHDGQADSAVFVDNLVVGFAPNPGAQCAQGATPKGASISLAPPTASTAVGASHTVKATVKKLDGSVVAAGPVLFTVSGANSTTGSATTDASGVAAFSYTGAATGDDTITGCYDANGNGTCGAGEPLASVNATWTAASATPTPSPTATPTTSAAPGFGGLPVTGSPVGLIAGAGAVAVLLGVGGYLLIRRRRVRFIAE